MSTVHVCAGCGKEMERYDGDEPYREIADCLCSDCASGPRSMAAFDAAFAEYELGQYRVDGW